MQEIDMSLMVSNIFMRKDNRTEANVSQIKEVLKIFLEEMAEYNDDEILEVINRYRKVV